MASLKATIHNPNSEEDEIKLPEDEIKLPEDEVEDEEVETEEDTSTPPMD